jgi:hypothetical protein
VLALPACGGDETDGIGAAAPRTALAILVQPDGPGGRRLEATLECDPPGGTHPDPDAACKALAANRSALDPVPADVVCSQLYGGPSQATIRGTLDGREVAAELNRRNGCEIERWDRLAPVLAIASP